MAGIKTRKVQGKTTETFDTFTFDGKNNVEVVEFFLNRGEHADNFGTFISWHNPDSGESEILNVGDHVVVVNDTPHFLSDKRFKLFFEPAKSPQKENPEK